MDKHSFVICTYKESPYLEQCILSLKRQKRPSKILISTSTPNAYVEALAVKYDIPVIVNPDPGDIQIDWNFAYNACDAQYVTLVHQDDKYSRVYSEHLFRAIEQYDDIAIFYSNYRALVTREDGEEVRNDINCRLRNLLCFPMRFSALQTRRGWKRATLRFGNSICCSSVTYNKTVLGHLDVFKSELRYCLDWDTFWEIAALRGRFYYDKRVLTYFRIHELATSMLCIRNHVREREDEIMFGKMWPRPIVKGIMHFYKLAYCNYKKLK